jgi:two-component system, chemotaxis family, chemotaxis protein CheY
MARTVLIVDDVEFVRKTISEILTEAHYHVVGEAANGAQAVEMYSRLRPDVVTMDIVMPEVSGLDAARRILKNDKQARIVIISAMGQENLVMEAINIGARDYVLKPFSAADILKSIERAFEDEAQPSSRSTQAR